MSDKFKSYRDDRKPKKFKGDFSPDFKEGQRGEKSMSKRDRKMRTDKSWKRNFV